jgi:Bifunctional DNA primase/polymerase, N-terminal/Primase C terminal 1 (PriCT-1)
MTMAAFADFAQQYVAAGMVPIPVGNDKRPGVRHWQKFGQRAALDIAAKPKFADANLGFLCGARSGTTVIDIDSSSDRELRYAIDTYGESPVMVETASGKHHLWFRHNGERRRIRPDKSHPIDVLGEGGYAIAPPSRLANGGRYRFIQGGFDDLKRLPTIKVDALHGLDLRRGAPQNRNASCGTVVGDSGELFDGTRNQSLAAIARYAARHASSLDALLAEVRQANADHCKPPLADRDVVWITRSAWRYKVENRLMVKGEKSIVLPSTIDRLLAAGELDVVLLMNKLRSAHGGTDDPFAVCPEAMAQARLIVPWGRNRYRTATRRACELGELKRIHAGGRGKGDPSLYVFPPRRKGSNPDPNLTLQPPLSVPGREP